MPPYQVPQPFISTGRVIKIAGVQILDCDLGHTMCSFARFSCFFDGSIRRSRVAPRVRKRSPSPLYSFIVKRAGATTRNKGYQTSKLKSRYSRISSKSSRLEVISSAPCVRAVNAIRTSK